MTEAWRPTYQELQDMYGRYFSLSYLNTDISNKFALISLICFLTKHARKKDPDANCYRVIIKVLGNKEANYDREFIKGLSIVCEDFYKNTTDFMTFNLKSASEIVKKIVEILDTYLPF